MWSQTGVGAWFIYILLNPPGSPHLIFYTWPSCHVQLWLLYSIQLYQLWLWPPTMSWTWNRSKVLPELFFHVPVCSGPRCPRIVRYVNFGLSISRRASKQHGLSCGEVRNWGTQISMGKILMANRMRLHNRAYFLLLCRPIQFAISIFCIEICVPHFCTRWKLAFFFWHVAITVRVGYCVQNWGTQISMGKILMANWICLHHS